MLVSAVHFFAAQHGAAPCAESFLDPFAEAIHLKNCLVMALQSGAPALNLTPTGARKHASLKFMVLAIGMHSAAHSLALP